MSDIYAAPTSKLELLEEIKLAPQKKPKAVLLLQVWALVIVALVAVAFMKNLHNLDGRAYYVFMGMSGKTRSYIMLGMIVSLLAMLYGLDKRALVGRIFGLFVIVVTAAPVFLQFFVPYKHGGPAEALVRYVLLAVLCLPFVYWGFAFSFSERARGYFGQPADD